MHNKIVLSFVAILFFNNTIAMDNWNNWAGNQQCSFKEIIVPENKQELINTIKKIIDQQKTIRIVGAGHSWSKLICDAVYLIDIKNLNKILSIDNTSGLIKVEAGITLEELNQQLTKHNLALANQPAVMAFTLAGAMSTGTHGSGSKTGSLSSFIVAGELITADGQLITISADTNSELLPALRVSLGTLGVIYSLTIQCVPLFSLHSCTMQLSRSDFFKKYKQLYNDNDYFQAVWDKEQDSFFIYTNNKNLKNNNECSFRQKGYEALSSYKSGAKRLEEEIAIDQKDFKMALEDINKLIDTYTKKGLPVTQVLCRFVPADTNTLLSMSQGRDSVFLSISTPVDDRYLAFFKKFEETLYKYKGRPHWGKINFLTYQKSFELYKNNFLLFIKLKNKLDPRGVFSSNNLNKLLQSETK